MLAIIIRKRLQLYNTKSVFLAVIAILRWLNNASDIVLNPSFLENIRGRQTAGTPEPIETPLTIGMLTTAHSRVASNGRDANNTRYDRNVGNKHQ